MEDGGLSVGTHPGTRPGRAVARDVDLQPVVRQNPLAVPESAGLQHERGLERAIVYQKEASEPQRVVVVDGHVHAADDKPLRERAGMGACFTPHSRRGSTVT